MVLCLEKVQYYQRDGPKRGDGALSALSLSERDRITSGKLIEIKGKS